MIDWNVATSTGVRWARPGPVVSMAEARDGQLFAFAFMADRLSSSGLDAGASDLTRLATALAGCGCG